MKNLTRAEINRIWWQWRKLEEAKKKLAKLQAIKLQKISRIKKLSRLKQKNQVGRRELTSSFTRLLNFYRCQKHNFDFTKGYWPGGFKSIEPEARRVVTEIITSRTVPVGSSITSKSLQKSAITPLKLRRRVRPVPVRSLKRFKFTFRRRGKRGSFMPASFRLKGKLYKKYVERRGKILEIKKNSSLTVRQWRWFLAGLRYSLALLRASKGILKIRSIRKIAAIRRLVETYGMQCLLEALKLEPTKFRWEFLKVWNMVVRKGRFIRRLKQLRSPYELPLLDRRARSLLLSGHLQAAGRKPNYLRVTGWEPNLAVRDGDKLYHRTLGLSKSRFDWWGSRWSAKLWKMASRARRPRSSYIPGFVYYKSESVPRWIQRRHRRRVIRTVRKRGLINNFLALDGVKRFSKDTGSFNTYSRYIRNYRKGDLRSLVHRASIIDKVVARRAKGNPIMRGATINKSFCRGKPPWLLVYHWLRRGYNDGAVSGSLPFHPNSPFLKPVKSGQKDLSLFRWCRTGGFSTLWRGSSKLFSRGDAVKGIRNHKKFFFRSMLLSNQKKRLRPLNIDWLKSKGNFRKLKEEYSSFHDTTFYTKSTTYRDVAYHLRDSFYFGKVINWFSRRGKRSVGVRHLENTLYLMKKSDKVDLVNYTQQILPLIRVNIKLSPRRRGRLIHRIPVPVAGKTKPQRWGFLKLTRAVLRSRGLFRQRLVEEISQFSERSGYSYSRINQAFVDYFKLASYNKGYVYMLRGGKARKRGLGY